MSLVQHLEYIETPRMWLRCPCPGDGEAVYQGVQETLPQLRAWPDSLPWAQQQQSIQGSEDYCQTSYAAYVMGISWPLLMIDKASQGFVGSIGFRHDVTSSRQWELGYWCRLSCQGQGRMTEAVSALTQAAIWADPLVQLVCRIDSRNLASIKVIERVGYRCEGEEALSRESGHGYKVRHYAWPRDLQTGQSG